MKYFEHIPVQAAKGMILMRLGYKKNRTVLNDEQQRVLDKGIKQGIRLCQPKGVFGRFNIVQHSQSFIELQNQQILRSKNLSLLLEKSDEVVLMASTVGKAVIEKISHEVNEGDAALGVILDAVASQTADAGLNWMMEFIYKIVRREGKKLTKHRYSPGYGDFSLENQKVIFDMLKLDRLGLKLTEKFMLIPEKSVLAIAGIERIEANE
ncbi:MAG: hypothetical protein PWQ70_1806 [Clostridiales bacterium]|nr:hypothetical protein [Clostridiales bacterium]